MEKRVAEKMNRVGGFQVRRSNYGFCSTWAAKWNRQMNRVVAPNITVGSAIGIAPECTVRLLTRKSRRQASWRRGHLQKKEGDKSKTPQSPQPPKPPPPWGAASMRPGLALLAPMYQVKPSQATRLSSLL